MDMKSLKRISALVLFVLVTATFIFSDEINVRITVTKANIRLEPSTQSTIVSTVPLGAVLEVIKKEGNWYFVKLPPDEKGIVVTGYIHHSTVEIFEEIEKVEKADESKIEEKNEIEEERTTEEIKEKAFVKKSELETQADLEMKPLSERERYLMKTEPYYPTWKRKLEQAEKEKKSATKWVWLGIGGMGVGYLVMPIAGAVAFTGGAGEEGNKMVTIGMGIGILGTATMIYGLVQRSSKGGKIAKILEEGMIKGYIGANINPGKKQYAVTFAIAF